VIRPAVSTQSAVPGLTTSKATRPDQASGKPEAQGQPRLGSIPIVVSSALSSLLERLDAQQQPKYSIRNRPDHSVALLAGRTAIPARRRHFSVQRERPLEGYHNKLRTANVYSLDKRKNELKMTNKPEDHPEGA